MPLEINLLTFCRTGVARPLSAKDGRHPDLNPKDVLDAIKLLDEYPENPENMLLVQSWAKLDNNSPVIFLSVA